MEKGKAPTTWKDPWTYAQMVGAAAFAAALWRAHGPGTWSAFWETISGQTAAAWVQAVGSIAAIAAAFSVASRGQRREERRRFDDDTDRLRVIASAIFHCRVEATIALDSNAWIPTLRLNGLHVQWQALQKISLLEVPDWRASIVVQNALSTHAQLAVGIPSIDVGPNALAPGGMQWWEENTRLHLNAAQMSFEELELKVRDILLERGSDVPEQSFTFNGRVYRPAGQGAEPAESSTHDHAATAN